MTIETKYQKLLDDIEKLQTIQRHIWNSYKNSDGENAALTEIIELKNHRYSELKELWKISKENLESSKLNLGSTETMNRILDSQLDNNNAYIDSLKEVESNKRRMTEIGTYEYERYKEHLAVIKYLASGALIIFLTKILMRKEWFPNALGITIMIVTIAYLVIHLASRLYYNFYRDNQDYTKFKFPEDPELREQKLKGQDYGTNYDAEHTVLIQTNSDLSMAANKISRLEKELYDLKRKCPG
jgi:hypothetical protein